MFLDFFLKKKKNPTLLLVSRGGHLEFEIAGSPSGECWTVKRCWQVEEVSLFIFILKIRLVNPPPAIPAWFYFSRGNYCLIPCLVHFELCTCYATEQMAGNQKSKGDFDWIVISKSWWAVCLLFTSTWIHFKEYKTNRPSSFLSFIIIYISI